METELWFNKVGNTGIPVAPRENTMVIDADRNISTTNDYIMNTSQITRCVYITCTHAHTSTRSHPHTLFCIYFKMDGFSFQNT